MFCCFVYVLNKIKNLLFFFPLLCFQFSVDGFRLDQWRGLAAPGPVWGDSHLGNLTVCFLASRCLWSSQPLSCSNESEVTNRAWLEVWFLFIPAFSLHYIAPEHRQNSSQHRHKKKNKNKKSTFFYILDKDGRGNKMRFITTKNSFDEYFSIYP